MITAWALVRPEGTKLPFNLVAITFDETTGSLHDQAILAFHFHDFEIKELKGVQYVKEQETFNKGKAPLTIKALPGYNPEAEAPHRSASADVAAPQGAGDRYRPDLQASAEPAPSGPPAVDSSQSRLEAVLDAISRMSEIDPERGRDGTGAISLEDANVLVSEIERLRR